MAVRGFASVFVSIALFAACDLQPGKQRDKTTGTVAPNPTPPAAPPPGTEPLPSPLPPTAGVVDAGVAKPPTVQTTEDCTTVAAHIAELAIAAIDDPTQRAVQEQDRTRMVRKLAELCTTNKWSDVARGCFLAGKTAEDVENCGRKHVQPTEPPPQ
jgi:hypothetical protein